MRAELSTTVLGISVLSISSSYFCACYLYLVSRVAANLFPLGLFVLRETLWLMNNEFQGDASRDQAKATFETKVLFCLHRLLRFPRNKNCYFNDRLNVFLCFVFVLLFFVLFFSHSISREQPIFTCKAHVFHIDPKTKRSWIPASSSAINVSFFYDSTRTLYRIISVEGTKVSDVFLPLAFRLPAQTKHPNDIVPAALVLYFPSLIFSPPSWHALFTR